MTLRGTLSVLLALLFVTPVASAGTPSDVAEAVHTLACSPPAEGTSEACSLAGATLNATMALVESMHENATGEHAHDAVDMIEDSCASPDRIGVFCDAMAGDPGLDDERWCEPGPSFSEDPARFLVHRGVERSDQVTGGLTGTTFFAGTPLEGERVCRPHWGAAYGLAALLP